MDVCESDDGFDPFTLGNHNISIASFSSSSSIPGPVFTPPNIDQALAQSNPFLWVILKSDDSANAIGVIRTIINEELPKDFEQFSLFDNLFEKVLPDKFDHSQDETGRNFHKQMMFDRIKIKELATEALEIIRHES